VLAAVVLLSLRHLLTPEEDGRRKAPAASAAGEVRG
jgi:hypothetical protein